MEKSIFGATNISQKYSNESKIHYKIIRLAKIVRNQFETEYPSNSTLAGLCGLASFRLMKLANNNGMYPALCGGYYKNYGHCWIEINDKIIDITAGELN